MFGNDAQHAGVNAIDNAHPPAITSWSVPISTTYPLHPVTSDGARVFVTYQTSFNPVDPLVALSVSDGSELWRYNFGEVDSVGHPAIVDGVVYLQTNKGISGQSQLWAFDAITGDIRWTAAFGSQWEDFWAPLVVDGSVYVNGGTYGGLYGFRASDGGQIFFHS